MKFDLSLFDRLPDSHYRRAYDLLMCFIVTRGKLDREQKSMQEKEKAWREITNPSKPGAPATKAEKEQGKQEKEKKEKKERTGEEGEGKE